MFLGLIDCFPNYTSLSLCRSKSFLIMSDNTSNWEFADKPDCDLLLDDTVDFEPASEPEEPVYAVVCDADGVPLSADAAETDVELTPANRSLDDEDIDPPNESIGYVSFNDLLLQPPPPPAAGDMEYSDSGDYEDLWDLQVGCQGDDKSYEVWNDDPAKYAYPPKILELFSLPIIHKPTPHITTRNNTTTTSSGMVDIKQRLDAHQSLAVRDLGHYKPFSSLYRDNNGKETTDYGSRVVPGDSARNYGAFNNDVRSTSTIVHGNNTIPPRGPIMKDLPEDPYTISASVLQDSFGCACLPKAGTHKINAEKTILLVLGDGFVPPCIGGNGCCAIVIRVDRATPNTILTAAKNFLEATGDAAFSIPADSIIIISMTSYLLEVKAAMYLTAVDALKRNLAKLFFTCSPASCNESINTLDCNVTAMNYRLMDVVVPHSPVDIQAAVAAATVVHVATVVVGANEDQLLGTIPNSYNTFMMEKNSAL